MPGVLIKRGHLDKETDMAQGGCPVKVTAETGGMQPALAAVYSNVIQKLQGEGKLRT